jgi:hypothetical protein
VRCATILAQAANLASNSVLALRAVISAVTARRPAGHFRRSPIRLGLEEVRAYQLHLVAQQRSWSHINQVVLLRCHLGWTDPLELMVAAPEPQKPPVVLNADEIVRFFSCATEPR